MGSEAPSWADQWGAGGIGAMEDDGLRSQKDTVNCKKLNAKAGFWAKAKAATMVGVHKIKRGTSSCVKWIKHRCNRKNIFS